MANLSKLLATLAIWAAIALIAIVAIANSMFIDDSQVIAVMTVVPLLIGFIVTLAMWAPAVFPWVDANRLRAMNNGQEQAHLESEKRKREAGGSSADEADARIDMLMRMMTPDEREDFKQTLKERILNDLTVGDDGELKSGGVSLKNLLDDASDTRHGRR